ncbi:hypothetical protein TNCV_4733951 [Trichonephila clavipes]|nr:hypothetical protein TNCV_4733951 [Trichonephila clavipes]
MPSVPNSVYPTLGPEVYEQMFRSGGQSDAKPPVLSSHASLVLILSTHGRDERPSQPLPARGLNLRPVVWKLDALTTQHWDSRKLIKVKKSSMHFSCFFS